MPKEFEVEIPAGLSGKAAKDAAAEALADQLEKMTDDDIGKAFGL